MNINKQGNTVQNLTRKHTKSEEKVKLDNEAHQDETQDKKTRLLLGTKHVLDGNYVIRPEWFRPWKMFWGGQICNDEYTSKNSKNVDFDCIMKAFFDERNNSGYSHRY